VKKLNTSIVISIISALCAGILLTACGNQVKETSETDTIETQQTAERQGIDVFGEVKAYTTRDIIIDFPARVEKIHIKDGEMVKKGDKIITLNFEEYETDILKKKNEIQLYEGQLKQLKQNINPLVGEVTSLRNELNIKQSYIDSDKDPEVKALQRALELAETAQKTAKKDYEVNKEIFEIGGISPKELEDSKQNLSSKEKEKDDLVSAIEMAKTNRKLEVNELRAALKSSEAQLTNTDKQNETGVLELESKLNIAKLDLGTMEKKLNKSYIKEKDIIADTDHMIIFDITCNEGTIIGKNETPVFKAMDENTLFVSVDIPEEFIGKASIGNEVSIVPYADKDKSLRGKIMRLGARAIKQNGETVVKADIKIEGEKGVLRPGLTVDAKIYE
jgi:multidrug efflux pump subunit AcrA (membrane-fusion protein)